MIEMLCSLKETVTISTIGILYDVDAPVYEDADETLSAYNLRDTAPYKLTESDLEEFY